MRICATVLIIFCPVALWAQNFQADGILLPKVERNGFYRIFISPQAGTYINDRFSNLRIHDQGGKEVPYLLHEEKPTYFSEKFNEYPIVEKKHLKDCCTSLILNNVDGKPINNISLLIKNADVSKRATLLGSDDQKEWYAVKEHFLFQSINNSSGTSEIKVVDFPLTNYNYLSLLIDDSTSAPLNILKAGYYNVLTASGRYTEVPVQKIVTQDSASQKKTYIYLKLDTTYFIDKIELTMGGAQYFLRQAELSDKKSLGTKKGENEFYQHITSFEVSSSGPSVVHLPETKTNEIRIAINNEDNPSLHIVSVNALQLNRYLIAWLKKDEQYKVKFGDNKTYRPDYDLTFFKDSIPDQPLILNIGEIRKINSEAQAESSPIFFTTKYFIWGAIIAVIAVLGFLSIRLIKEASE